MKIKKLKIKKLKKSIIVRGNYRLSSGMYRTKEEQEKYFQKSIKRRMP